MSGSVLDKRATTSMSAFFLILVLRFWVERVVQMSLVFPSGMLFSRMIEKPTER